MNPLVLIVGTRPELIKMVPVYRALKERNLPVVLVSTGQHADLLADLFALFGIQPDIDLALGKPNQDLAYITSAVIARCSDLYRQLRPSAVIVQGDTATITAAALAAFYLKIPVGHVEAGLRTNDITQPFPEELNRRIVGLFADFHFVPTAASMGNLLAERVPREKIFCTGNTVVDASQHIMDAIAQGAVAIAQSTAQLIAHVREQEQQLVLFTMHRRESFGAEMARVLQALGELAEQYPQLRFVYPTHPNPAVQAAVAAAQLHRFANIQLIAPLSYADLTYVLHHAVCVVTDSGGIQEEAVSIGKPTLVLRAKTERPEGVWEGMAHLVGTEPGELVRTFAQVMGDTHHDAALQIYGDGRAAQRIAHILDTAYHAGTLKQWRDMSTVTVIGLGYIGLPTAIVAAEHGFVVHGFDVDVDRVTAINTADPVIKEPEIHERLHTVVSNGTLRASTEITSADYYIIAVPTPFLEDKKADLSYVDQAAHAIAHVLRRGQTVILESTVPVGTTDRLAAMLAKLSGLSAGTDFFVAHCPERVLPGKIFFELINNARTIGGICSESTERARKFYAPFVRGSLHLTSAKTAEMVKLVENSSRDVAIAFANQVASMATAAGLNPYDVIELANKHPRVNILKPGCGVGGHCIAVDPWFLVETFPEHTALLKAARQVNDAKPYQVLATVKQRVSAGQTILVLGLTYKADVDDLRESPALLIAQEMHKWGNCTVLVCEPHVQPSKLKALFGDNVVSLEQGLARADIVVSLVAHRQFADVASKLIPGQDLLDFCGQSHKSGARPSPFVVSDDVSNPSGTRTSRDAGSVQCFQNHVNGSKN